MLEIIIAILMNLGFNFNSSNHFTISANVAEKIKNSSEYQSRGGDSEFNKFVTVSNQDLDDIVVTDDDNPVR